MLSPDHKRLIKVNWQRGMTLDVEHFRVHEEYIDNRREPLCQQLITITGYGILPSDNPKSFCEDDKESLVRIRNGEFIISECNILTRPGNLIHIEKDSLLKYELPKAISGYEKKSVFVLLGWCPEHLPVGDAPGENKEACALSFELRITSDSYPDQGNKINEVIDYFKIAEIEYSDNRWNISQEFMPACIDIKALKEWGDLYRQFKEYLSRDMTAFISDKHPFIYFLEIQIKNFQEDILGELKEPHISPARLVHEIVRWCRFKMNLYISTPAIAVDELEVFYSQIERLASELKNVGELSRQLDMFAGADYNCYTQLYNWYDLNFKSREQVIIPPDTPVKTVVIPGFGEFAEIEADYISKRMVSGSIELQFKTIPLKIKAIALIFNGVNDPGINLRYGINLNLDQNSEKWKNRITRIIPRNHKVFIEEKLSFIIKTDDRVKSIVFNSHPNYTVNKIYYQT